MSKVQQIKINQWLKNYGYIPSVSYGEVTSLDYNSSEITEAKNKLQLFYDDPDDLQTIITTPRCGHPDFDDPESIKFGADRSWKKGCIPEYPNDYGAVINFDTGKMPAKIKAYFDKAMEVVVKAQAQVGFRFVVQKDKSSNAHMLESFSYMPGGKIGFHYYPRSGSCNRITGSFDTSWTPDNYFTWAELVLHEAGGHGCGLGHTRSGIMSPTIKASNKEPSWINDVSYSKLVSYFGGPITPTVPDPTPVNQFDSMFKALLEMMKKFLNSEN